MGLNRHKWFPGFRPAASGEQMDAASLSLSSHLRPGPGCACWSTQSKRRVIPTETGAAEKVGRPRPRDAAPRQRQAISNCILSKVGLSCWQTFRPTFKLPCLPWIVRFRHAAVLGLFS